MHDGFNFFSPKEDFRQEQILKYRSRNIFNVKMLLFWACDLPMNDNQAEKYLYLRPETQ